MQEEVVENQYQRCINRFVKGEINLDGKIDDKECFIKIDESLNENGYEFNFVVPGIDYKKNEKLFVSGSHRLNSGGYLIVDNVNIAGEGEKENQKNTFKSVLSDYEKNENVDTLFKTIFNPQKHFQPLLYLLRIKPDGQLLDDIDAKMENVITDYINSVSTESKDRPQILKKIRDAIIAVLALPYKIHIQVKPENLPQFFAFLAKAVAGQVDDCDLSNDIYKFKAISKIDDNLIEEQDPFPTVVLYVKTFGVNQDLVERRDKLIEILNKLYRLEGEFCEKMNNLERKDLVFRRDNGEPIIPRMNKAAFEQPTTIYIAGGNADDKISFKEKLKDDDMKNTVFTDDYVFYEGHELKNLPLETPTE